MLREPLHALRKRLPIAQTTLILSRPPAFDRRFWLTRSFTSPRHRESVSTMKIHRAAHRALGRVLDGHHAVVGLAALDRAKDVVERGQRDGVDERSEVLVHGRVAERSGRTEIRHAQRLLERAARRHHLPEDPRDVLVGAAVPRFAACRPCKYLRLALRPVCERAAPPSARRSPARARRAHWRRFEDLAIQGVDRLSMLVKLWHWHPTLPRLASGVAGPPRGCNSRRTGRSPLISLSLGLIFVVALDRRARCRRASSPSSTGRSGSRPGWRGPSRGSPTRACGSARRRS